MENGPRQNQAEDSSRGRAHSRDVLALQGNDTDQRDSPVDLSHVLIETNQVTDSREQVCGYRSRYCRNEIWLPPARAEKKKLNAHCPFVGKRNT